MCAPCLQDGPPFLHPGPGRCAKAPFAASMPSSGALADPDTVGRDKRAPGPAATPWRPAGVALSVACRRLSSGRRHRPRGQLPLRRAQVNTGDRRFAAEPAPMGASFHEAKSGSMRARERTFLGPIEGDFDTRVAANVLHRIYVAINCHCPRARRGPGRFPSVRLPRKERARPRLPVHCRAISSRALNRAHGRRLQQSAAR
jgi:hypothetical protein